MIGSNSAQKTVTYDQNTVDTCVEFKDNRLLGGGGVFKIVKDRRRMD